MCISSGWALELIVHAQSSMTNMRGEYERCEATGDAYVLTVGKVVVRMQ